MARYVSHTWSKLMNRVQSRPQADEVIERVRLFHDSLMDADE
jgi:hypothetical protein